MFEGPAIFSERHSGVNANVVCRVTLRKPSCGGVRGDKALAVAERQRLYREAEAAYMASLEVFTKEAALHYHGMCQRNLARLRAKMASAK